MRRTLLVVEDDPIILAYYESVLVHAGFPIVPASNAEEALETLHAHDDIACVISDIRLPGMTGLAFVKRARELRPNLAVVLISAEIMLEEDDVPEDCVFIAKPVRVTDILAAVRERIPPQ
jgi:DNA-binding NtrC family response regulator